MFDFAQGSFTLETYSKFLEDCLNEKPPKTLIKMAFKIYDFNSDRKLDELDLFAIMYQFESLSKGVQGLEVK